MQETAALVAMQPSADVQRIGVYVFAAIAGLLVCGLITIARELRAEAASKL